MFQDDFPRTCLSCGLLGFIDHHVTPRTHLFEMGANRRANGYIAERTTTLWCLRRMAYPQREVDEAKQEIEAAGQFKPEVEHDSTYSMAIRRVLQRPRPTCVEKGVWHPYTEYFDPKWHYEEWRMMELERPRQQQALISADALKAIRDIQTEHAAIMATAEKETGRFNRLFLLLGIAATVLAIVALAATLAYPNGATWVVAHAPGAVDVRTTPEPSVQSTATSQPSTGP